MQNDVIYTYQLKFKACKSKSENRDKVERKHK